MITKALRAYLDRERVPYTLLSHAPAFTAQEIAAASHISGRNLAKTVILRINDDLAMAVLPANQQIDLDLLRELTDFSYVALAEESEFHDHFPGCETGAMPPFGPLFKMDVFVAEELTEDTMIYFNAGTHTELFQMRFVDFERLVHPRILPFTTQLH